MFQSPGGGEYLTSFWTGTCHQVFKNIPVPYTNLSKMYTRLHTSFSKIYTRLCTNFPKMHTRPYTNCEIAKIDTVPYTKIVKIDTVPYTKIAKIDTLPVPKICIAPLRGFQCPVKSLFTLSQEEKYTWAAISVKDKKLSHLEFNENCSV